MLCSNKHHVFFPTYITIIPNFPVQCITAAIFVVLETVQNEDCWVKDIYKRKYKPDSCYKCVLKKMEPLSFTPCKDLAFCSLGKTSKNFLPVTHLQP